MRIYFFSKDIERKHYSYGTGKYNNFTSAEELIASAENFFERENPRITEKEKNLIVSEEIPDYDFYAVQDWCDGFGNDTVTLATFKTKQECDNFISQERNGAVIVGQHFGKEYRNYF